MTVLALLATLLTFFIVMIVFPRIVFPLSEVPGTFLDRALAGVMLFSALNMAAMYVFGSIGMLETLPLVAVWVITWWFLKGRKRPKGRLVDSGGRFLKFLDDTEDRGFGGMTRSYGTDLRDGSGRRLRGRWAAFRDSYPGHGAALVSIAVLVVLAVAAYLRFSRSLQHVELVPQDSYLALYWTKSITNGEILKEGIYPQGVYLWLSLLDRFYPMSTYNFIRFAGPMMATLELITLYWVVSRVSRSRAAGLLSLAFFGLFAGAPSFFVDWSRQIGAMTQEMALAFAIVSLVYGGLYMTTRRPLWLALAMVTMFAAVTSHTVTLIPLAIGYAAIVVVGLLSASWDRQSFLRLVGWSLAAVAAGNIYFLIGWLKGNSLVQSFALYNPSYAGGFSGTGTDVAGVAPGDATFHNAFFQIGLAGAVVAIVIGLFVMFSGQRDARVLVAYGITCLAMMLVYDFVFVRYGLLFRVRAMWATVVFLTLGVGLGLGAVIGLAGRLARVRDLLSERSEGRDRPRRTVVELVGAVIAIVVMMIYWPAYASASREVGPSGYPQATEVSLDIIDSEDRLTYTFVGMSEQFQESAFQGWFIEAWVFARDIRMSAARSPEEDVPIPTNTFYVFVEKEVFRGPESPPFGPTEEYYRNSIKRERIMQRISRWMELYSSTHRGVSIVHDDAQLRVYKVRRNVSQNYARGAPEFKDYTWRPGEYFDDDGDITAERVRPNPRASTLPAGPQV